MFFKTKVKDCSVCSAPVSFEYFILDTLQGQKIDNPEKNIFCKKHFLEMVEDSMNQFSYPFIFYKPKDFSKDSQMFYYIRKKLLEDDYSKEDCDNVMNLLLTVNPTTDTNLISVDAELIKSATDAPLFKAKPEYKLVEKKEFLKQLSDYLLELSSKFPEKGSFWFMLPYLEKGIYIYFDYQ